MSDDRESLEDKVRRIAREYPLAPWTGRSCAVTALRRMKAEKTAGIPVSMRSGFAISRTFGRAANRLTEEEWDQFYEELREDCLRRYPESRV